MIYGYITVVAIDLFNKSFLLSISFMRVFLFFGFATKFVRKTKNTPNIDLLRRKSFFVKDNHNKGNPLLFKPV